MQSHHTDTFPLFLTPAAQAGSILPSGLLNKQMHILLGAGVSWERLNPKLRAAFLLGYYLGNVRNGGHSQFMGNARNFYGGDPLRFLEWAMEAAQRYGMSDTQKIMRNVQVWMAENPKEASTQTGFTPHVSPALEPYDTALYKADTVDEETWLARVNTLPEAHAQTFLHMRSYKEGYVRFPAIVSEIEELRLLVEFDPVKIVGDDSFETEVKAVVAADPVAKAARLSTLLTELEQTLPKPATCAALSLFAEGAHLPSREYLRAGAAKPRGMRRSGVLATPRGDHAFIVELGKNKLSVFEAAGDPDAVLDNMVSFPSNPRRLASFLFYLIDPKRRVERTFRRIARQKMARKTRRLGDVSNSVGDEIAELNRRFHLKEALALWLEQAQVDVAPAKWRLELVKVDRVHWLFETADNRLNVIASATEVQIAAGGTTQVYQHDDLSALRQTMEGTT